MASSAGATRGECAASETNSFWPCTSRVAKSASKASTAWASPETTTLSGALMAAMASRSARGAMARPTSSAEANTAAMAPPGGRACISRPRSAMSLRPSSSVNTPATQAATYSPTEWPITAAGSMPQARQSCVSAYSTAKSAGCVHMVSCTAAPSLGPARSTVLSVRPWASAPSRRSQRSMISR